MAYPTKPSIATSYTAEEQALGNGTFPGQELDVDLAAIQTSAEEIVDFLKLFTRSDGALANGIVTTESLASSVLIGFDPPAPWATATDYTTSSTVFEGYGFYLCLVDHTAGTFSTDLAAGRWQLLADLTPPTGGLIAANNLSDVDDAATARANLGAQVSVTGGASTITTSNLTADRALVSNGSGKVAVSAVTATEIGALAGVTETGTSLITAADAAAVRTAAGATTAGSAVFTAADAAAQRTAMGLGTAAVADLIDEDNMATDSATRPPSQQSVKAYVDTSVAAVSTASMTLLGTITTTSGSSASLGSLTLTDYKALHCVFDGVSASSTFQITLDSISFSASTAAGNGLHGFADIDLGTGVAVSIMGVSGTNSTVWSANTSLSTATTTLTFGTSGGTFDAGSIVVYGVK